MAEALNVIFENIWNFLGTIIIIMSIGYSLSMPMFWAFKIRQMKLNRSIWRHEN